MGKLAIVGTSKLTDFESVKAMEIINNEYYRFPKPEKILTGDADGIDSLVLFSNHLTGIPVIVYKARDKNWGGEYGFKRRNLAIAEDCDEIICITTSIKTRRCYHCDADHQRSGGCFTLKAAKRKGKIARTYVI